MAKMVLDKLEPGMVLAADVHDRAGRMLLGAGGELTAKHLVIFRTWGVEEVEIAGFDDLPGGEGESGEISSESTAAAEAALVPLFSTANREHPALVELFRLAVLRRAQHGSI